MISTISMSITGGVATVEVYRDLTMTSGTYRKYSRASAATIARIERLASQKHVVDYPDKDGDPWHNSRSWRSENPYWMRDYNTHTRAEHLTLHFRSEQR